MRKPPPFPSGPFVNAAFLCATARLARNGAIAAGQPVQRVEVLSPGPTRVKLMVVIRLDAVPVGRHALGILSENPTGQWTPPFIREFVIPKGKSQFEFAQRLSFDVADPGKYVFHVLLEAKYLTRIGLEVTIRAPRRKAAAKKARPSRGKRRAD